MQKEKLKGIITMDDVAKAWGVQEDSDNCISMAEYERVGLNMLGGCECCGASIAIYNAYPAKSGFWRCSDCIGEDGFKTVKDFEKEGYTNE